MVAAAPIVINDLPIFRLDGPTRSLYYTPGYVVILEAAQVDYFEAGLHFMETKAQPAAELLKRAITNQNKWLAMFNRSYEPLCLTLYLNNECNLVCNYCYSAAGAPRAALLKLSPEVIQSAAIAVATACAAHDLPFTVVFHGGGEPTLNKSQVDAALDSIEQVADRFALKLFRYIATNGVMSTAKAAWLARRFDQIGLSCDGPPEIQAHQRPLWNGRSSVPFVERTARVVRDLGRPLRVRVTLTPQSYTRQSEIAEYICEKLRPQEISIEPVYHGGRTGKGDGFLVEQAETFVLEYFKARQVARRHGVSWLFSGSRPIEIHGPYCNFMRNVLNLIPAGLATACFKITDSGQMRQGIDAIGKFDKSKGSFIIDQARIKTLRQTLSGALSNCKTCFNRFHCVRSCPDECLLESSTSTRMAEFRCRIQKLMMEKYLWESVESLCTANSIGIASKDLPFAGL